MSEERTLRQVKDDLALTQTTATRRRAPLRSLSAVLRPALLFIAAVVPRLFRGGFVLWLLRSRMRLLRFRLLAPPLHFGNALRERA
jgi:hypothetical protein